MKQNRLSIINALAAIIVITSVFTASIKTYFHVSGAIPAIDLFKNIWVAPILELIIFFLFGFLIRHPRLLVKKTQYEFEDFDQEQYDKTVNNWKNGYCYFRFVVILILTIVATFPDFTKS